MMEIINLKIDVTKITKSRLFKGERGTYLNCTLIPTPNSKYGEYMIKEDTTKEERDNNVEGAILGNGKVFKRRETPHANLGSKTSPNAGIEISPVADITPDSDLPF